MARPIRMIQTSLSGGEISPVAAGRIDIERYYSGAARMENVLVRPQGGARRRPGTRHVGTIPHAAPGGLRLIPFEFNNVQTYVICLYAGGFHVWRSDGLHLATVGGAPWTAGQALQMNWTQSSDTLVLAHPDMHPQMIRRGATEGLWSVVQPALGSIPTHDFGAGVEPVISATRGWPECVAFHRGRLWFGGLRSRPATFLASRVGDHFNLALGTAGDADAIMATIDSVHVNAIHQMVPGRGLTIYTSGSEFVVGGEPLTPRTIAVVEHTRRGIKRFSRVADSEGTNLFVQRGGAALRRFVFDNNQQAFRADQIGLLAPHLMLDPREAISRIGTAHDDADHIMMLTGDPAMVVVTMLAGENVSAFTRWTTAGDILAVAALASGEVFFATRRSGVICLEVWDQSCVTDGCALTVSGTPFSTLSGTSHLPGDAALILDGSFMGMVPVNGAASIALPRSARRAECGLPFFPIVRTMPLEPRDPAGPLVGRRSRLSRVTVRVNNSGTFVVNSHRVVVRGVGIAPNQPLDSPPPRLSGDITVYGLAGWAKRPAVEITQPIPGPLEILAVASRMEVAD